MTTSQYTDNPFETALLEGSPLTYLSMAKAGLSSSFNPLPLTHDGYGLVANFLSTHPGSSPTELCQTLLDFGLDPCQLQSWAASRHCMAWHYATNELDMVAAPLASLAIGSRNAGFDPFWQTLSPEKLATLADSAFPIACMSDHIPAMTALIQAGASVNMTDSQGMPLVARCSSPASLALLLDAGADLRAPLPRPHPKSTATTVHEALINTHSTDANAKAMRLMALSWVASHPPAEDPMAELARAAFKALANKNKEGARRCVMAMGTSALTQRDGQGDSLAVKAAMTDQFIEVGRLLNLGADPYEVMASGRSLLGELFAQHHLLSLKYGRTADQHRVTSLLGALESKRKYQPVPWTRKGPGGATLLESLIGRLPLPLFLSRLSLAHHAGLDLREPTSLGMDFPCRLAIHALFQSPWFHMIESRVSVRGTRDYNHEAIMKLLVAHPLFNSSTPSLVAMARTCAGIMTNVRSSFDGQLLNTGCDIWSPTNFGSPLLPAFLSAFEAWGASGAPQPDWNAMVGIPNARDSELARRFEIGCLSCASLPGSKPAARVRL